MTQSELSMLSFSPMATLGDAIYGIFNIYVCIIIARVLLTWINPNPYSPLMRFLSGLTDPLLNKARRIAPFTFGGIDFSPVLLIIAIQISGFVLGKGLFLIGGGASAAILLPLLAVAAVKLINSIAWLLIIVMAARLVMSLVSPAPYNPLVLIVYGLTEPLLAPLRGLFPRGPGGLDLRALMFLLAVILARQVLLKPLYALAFSWVGHNLDMGAYAI